MTAVPNIVAEAWGEVLRKGIGIVAGDSGNRYLALNTADPGETGASEVTGLDRVALALNEQQTLTITGTPTGGSFTLTFGTDTTAAIDFDATADQVRDALMALPSVVNPSGDWSVPGKVVVTGGPLPDTALVIEFQWAHAQTDVALITADDANLTGGTTPEATVTTTRAAVNVWTAYADDGATSGRFTENEGVIQMGNATVAETATHGSLHDAPTSGVFLASEQLTGEVTYAIDQPVEIADGALDLFGAGQS